MEKLGVIEKVSELTELFSGMVVVTKPLGRIRICIDLKPPNENVFHPSPKVDATLALLSESKVFSNLALTAASGKCHYPLSPGYSQDSSPYSHYIVLTGCLLVCMYPITECIFCNV